MTLGNPMRQSGDKNSTFKQPNAQDMTEAETSNANV